MNREKILLCFCEPNGVAKELAIGGGGTCAVTENLGEFTVPARQSLARRTIRIDTRQVECHCGECFEFDLGVGT